jgi:hypothetical protein
MRTMLLYPTSDISDDVPIEQIRLPWNIRRTLAGAGLKTVGDVRKAANETLLRLRLNRGMLAGMATTGQVVYFTAISAKSRRPSSRQRLSTTFSRAHASEPLPGRPNAPPMLCLIAPENEGHFVGRGIDCLRLRELARAVQRVREDLVVPRPIGCRDRRFLDLLLPRIEDRRCRARCSVGQAQRRLRGSFCSSLLGRTACAAKLARRHPNSLRCRTRCLPSIG